MSTIVLFSEDMAQQVKRRRAIELDLRSAIEADMLCLHYQPIVSCESGKIVGVEALLRWRHPVHGEMSPADFIPIAENAGLLPSLGEWVLSHAMRDSRRWPDLEVAVNLSPVQFRHVDLESALRRLIAAYGIDPGRFVLELTEGVLLETTEHTNSILDLLRSIGFKTALDDFADDRSVGGLDRAGTRHGHRRRGRRNRVRGGDNVEARLHRIAGLLLLETASGRRHGAVPAQLPAEAHPARADPAASGPSARRRRIEPNTFRLSCGRHGL
jgi:hypothetical protein